MVVGRGLNWNEIFWDILENLVGYGDDLFLFDD